VRQPFLPGKLVVKPPLGHANRDQQHCDHEQRQPKWCEPLAQLNRMETADNPKGKPEDTREKNHFGVRRLNMSKNGSSILKTLDKKTTVRESAAQRSLTAGFSNFAAPSVPGKGISDRIAIATAQIKHLVAIPIKMPVISRATRLSSSRVCSTATRPSSRSSTG